ncbi:MAG: hypothetical protein M0Z27_06540, partial [Thermaerobacter sp.]|nr:hypothetical protein [Thermaerobacter sp.]
TPGMVLVLGAKQGSPRPCHPAAARKPAGGGKAAVLRRLPFIPEMEHRGKPVPTAMTKGVVDAGPGRTRAASYRQPRLDHRGPEQSACCAPEDIIQAIIHPGRYRGQRIGRLSLRFGPSFRRQGFDVHPKHPRFVGHADGDEYSSRGGSGVFFHG